MIDSVQNLCSDFESHEHVIELNYLNVCVFVGWPSRLPLHVLGWGPFRHPPNPKRWSTHHHSHLVRFLGRSPRKFERVDRPRLPLLGWTWLWWRCGWHASHFFSLSSWTSSSGWIRLRRRAHRDTVTTTAAQNKRSSGEWGRSAWVEWYHKFVDIFCTVCKISK